MFHSIQKYMEEYVMAFLGITGIFRSNNGPCGDVYQVKLTKHLVVN